MENGQDAGRLLILGSHWELAGLVRKAKKRGLYVCVCDGYPDGLARKYADKAFTEDVRNIEAVAAICREEKIDHIITSFSDLMFECMVRIADLAGLPCYADPAMLPAYRNKEIQKEICRRQGIHVPAFLRLRKDFRDSVIREAGISFPALLKPVDSYGSRGIRLVRSAQEIREFFDDSSRYSGDASALLEEWSEGQEINVHGFIAGGELTVLTAADRKTLPWRADTIPLLHTITYPAWEADTIRMHAQDLLARFIRETGQKWGPIAMQCFWNGEYLQVCEIAGRMLAFEHELIDMTTGLDTEELLLDLQYDRAACAEKLREFRDESASGERCACMPDQSAEDAAGCCMHGAENAGRGNTGGRIGEETIRTCACLGREPAQGWQQSPYSEGFYLQHIRGGKIRDMSNVETISGLKGVAECTLFYHTGETVGVLGPGQYFARVYTQAGGRRELEEIEREVLARCHARNERGEEMLLQVK